VVNMGGQGSEFNGSLVQLICVLFQP